MIPKCDPPEKQALKGEGVFAFSQGESSTSSVMQCREPGALGLRGPGGMLGGEEKGVVYTWAE